MLRFLRIIYYYGEIVCELHVKLYQGYRVRVTRRYLHEQV